MNIRKFNDLLQKSPAPKKTNKKTLTQQVFGGKNVLKSEVLASFMKRTAAHVRRLIPIILSTV